jgi:ELWxxDGT repeat protein
VTDINHGSGNGLGAGSEVTVFDGRLYFEANDGSTGEELWRTDGTPAGTSQVADIKPGPGNSFPGQFAVLGKSLLFAADDGVHGYELWRLTS